MGLAATFISVSAMAQLNGDEPAPNWTLTDIDGNTHTLYEYLDQGKFVVIDFSATWCPPCWSYHESHEMRDLYDQYGPDGTDEVMVFFIEGDASTNSADLAGTGSNTQGNWITGTTYPIIDDASMTSAYDIAAWPTIYTICPDRRIQSVGQSSMEAFLDYKANGCAAPSTFSGTDASVFTTVDFPETVCGDDWTGNAYVNLQNYGGEALTSATIELYANNDNLIASKEWTGNLSTTYDIEAVQFNNLVVPYWAGEIHAEVKNINGAASDDVMSNNMRMVNFEGAGIADSPNLTVEVMTDNYASEVSWRIYNSANSLVESSGTLQNSTLNSTDVTMGIYDCYRFVIEDSFGDGMLGNSYARIVSEAGTELFRIEGGSYRDDATRMVNVGHAITSINEVAKGSELSVFPNPFSDLTNVSYSLTEASEVRVDVVNVVGQTVYSKDFGTLSAGEQRFELDGTSLEAGMYLINVTVNDATVTKRVSLTK